jgi:four helix bundle protein
VSRLIKSYEDLLVWQKGVRLAVDLYEVTRGFPSWERFGLSSQIQRCGVSVPANIAEGFGKSGPGNYLSHLSHSRGSLCELDTLLVIGRDIGYIHAETHRELRVRTDEISRMLRGLAKSVAASSSSGLPHQPRTR